MTDRSGRPEAFCRIGVFKNFAKFAGKHLFHILFLNKVAGLSPATLWKKRIWRRSFPVNFAKFLRTHFFTGHLWWLFLGEDILFLIYISGISTILTGGHAISKVDHVPARLYSQHTSIIWPVWLNGWVFVYKLKGCGIKFYCNQVLRLHNHKMRFLVSSFEEAVLEEILWLINFTQTKIMFSTILNSSLIITYIT